MKKILVTGSNGLLGQKITQRFLEKRDFELIATSIGANRFSIQDGYLYKELDITDLQLLKQIITDTRPDAIINTAAMANPDACEPDHARCDLLNTTAVKYLADICQLGGIHLVHLSTDFIFDGKSGPYTETDQPNPLSHYGKSKLEAENILLNLPFKWTILRTVLVYGYLENMSRSNVVLWVKKSLEAGKPIRVVNDQWRTPTLAEDLAEACLLSIFKGAEGIYHIAGSEMMSIFEIAERVAGFWGLDEELMSPVPSSALNEPAKRPPITGFVIDKAVRELGFSPTTMGEGLRVIARQIDKFQKS